MEPAKVYFSDLRADEISTLEKLHRLMKAAGFEQIDFKDKYVAIKASRFSPTATRSMSAAAPTRSTISTAPCLTAIRP